MTHLRALVLACVISTTGAITTVTCGNDAPVVFIQPDFRPYHSTPPYVILPPNRMRTLHVDLPAPLGARQFPTNEEEDDDE